MLFRSNELYIAVTTLFQHRNAMSPHERQMALGILQQLTSDVEMSLRIKLAERLADEADAPHDLIVMLADDRIEIARPVLLRSRILTDNDLIRLIGKHGPEHQCTIAERPGIGEAVTAALVLCDSETVILTLLRNKSAKIGTQSYEMLCDRACGTPAMLEPLSQRIDLPQAAVKRLHSVVSSALSAMLSQRYPGFTQPINNALLQSGLHATPFKGVKTNESSAKKLIAKLSAAGSLGPSFLIRVLHQGEMELFEHGFSALLSVDVELMRRTLYGENPVNLALACFAAGIDRSVFITVFNLSRFHRKHPATLTAEQRAQIDGVFQNYLKNEALQKLKSGAA